MAKKNDKISSQPELRDEQLEKVSGGAYIEMEDEYGKYYSFFDDETGKWVADVDVNSGKTVQETAKFYGVSAEKLL